MDGDPIVEGEPGYACAVSGSGGRAREILQALLSRQGRGFGSVLPISKVYFGLGETERGSEWLKKAVEQHELSLDLKMDPVYDGLRPDPRFQAPPEDESHVSSSIWHVLQVVLAYSPLEFHAFHIRPKLSLEGVGCLLSKLFPANGVVFVLSVSLRETRPA
jgi:hypothetical protein